MKIGKNIFYNGLKEVFSCDIFRELQESQQEVLLDCLYCCWKNVCKGGSGILEKFSSTNLRNRFSNRSIYCRVYKSLFFVITKKLLNNGYSEELLLRTLSGEK